MGLCIEFKYIMLLATFSGRVPLFLRFFVRVGGYGVEFGLRGAEFMYIPLLN